MGSCVFHDARVGLFFDIQIKTGGSTVTGCRFLGSSWASIFYGWGNLICLY